MLKILEDMLEVLHLLFEMSSYNIMQLSLETVY